MLKMAENVGIFITFYSISLKSFKSIPMRERACRTQSSQNMRAREQSREHRARGLFFNLGLQIGLWDGVWFTRSVIKVEYVAKFFFSLTKFEPMIRLSEDFAFLLFSSKCTCANWYEDYAITKQPWLTDAFVATLGEPNWQYDMDTILSWYRTCDLP